MDFDPDDHDSQPIVASKASRRRLQALSARRFWCFAGTGIGWLASGIIFNTDKVEAAKPIKTSNEISRTFKVVVREISAQSLANTIILQARSEADKVVTVAAETGGTISQLPVEKGAFVQKGQIICRIDVGAREANLAQARAQRDARKIEFTAAKNWSSKGICQKAKWQRRRPDMMPPLQM